MNYETITIPDSPSQRQFHYGLRAMPAGYVEPITWYSDYGQHVHGSVNVVTDYNGMLEQYDAMRRDCARRIKFYRRVLRG